MGEPATIPVANTDIHRVRGNGWCFYQAALESAEGVTGKTDADSLALAKQLVGVLKDPKNGNKTLGGRVLTQYLMDISAGNLEAYLTKLETPRNEKDLNEGPQEWADGTLMSLAYTVQNRRVVNIYQEVSGNYTLRSSTKEIEGVDLTGGDPLSLVFSESVDGAGNKAGHFDWFSTRLAAVAEPPTPLTGLSNRIQGAAKSAIADAKLRLKTGSANEIVIAGERVRLDNTGNHVRHPDLAPISFYMSEPSENVVKVLRDIFTGAPEFDEENPLPPCNGDHAAILKNALEYRMEKLSEEIGAKRLTNNVKAKEHIRHYKKLEVMIDSLETATGCNKYGELKQEAITAKQAKRIEDLTRQFAFLVLQGIDPIDLKGRDALLKKSGNAKALIQLLDVNEVTDDEFTIYLNLRKTIPIFILNILDKSGAGRESFNTLIAQMVLDEQNTLVQRIIEILRGGELQTDDLIVNINRLDNPSEKILRIVEWLVGKYVECNEAAEEAQGRIRGLTGEIAGLRQNIETLTAENERIVQARDAALVAQREAEAAKDRAEGERDRALRDLQQLQRDAAEYVIKIQDLEEKFTRLTQELETARAKVREADGLQARLDAVNAELARLQDENRRLSAQVDALRRQMVAAENAAGEAGARAATAEAALAAYQRDNPGGDSDELARLQGELASARAAEESARAAAAEAIADLRRVEAERDAAKAATVEANRRANTATEKIAALEAEIAGLRQARAQDAANLAAASEDVRRLKAAIAEISGRDGADIGRLTEENMGVKGEIAELRRQVGPYQTQIEDLRAQLRAKSAELEDLRRSCGEKDFRISQLEVENRRIREELEAERARSTRLLAYLTELSTAITRGGPIPALPADIPDIGGLITKIGELRKNADPSKYLCLLSYYVKFFMTLLFNQPGGKAAYNALKEHIGPSISSGLGIIDEVKCYEFLEALKPTLDGAQGNAINIRNTVLNTIVQKVFGDATDQYRSIAAFVVASQLYLSTLYGLKRLPGCRVAPVILDPIGNLPRGEGVPFVAPTPAPAPARAPAPAPAPTTTYEYDYLKNPAKPYTEVSKAAQEAFNVEPVDQPVLTTVAKAKEYLADVKNAIRASGGVRFSTMGGNIDDYIRGKWSSKSKLDTVCTHKPSIPETGEICGEFNGLMNKNFSSLRSDAFKEQAAKDKLKALNLLL